MEEATSALVKTMALEMGIDLVGIASAEDLLLAYPPRPAVGVLPTARSVVVMVVAHSYGAAMSPDIRTWTRNKMQTSRLLDQAAEKISRHLESLGHVSVPVSADKPVEIFKRDPETGRRFRFPRVAGHLSLKHAAVSAGMGQLARSNLLLTPEFGPHQRLGGFVTEAPLQPDPPRRLDLCIEGCRRCEQACPVGALSGGGYEVDTCFNYWSLGLDRLPPKRPGELRPYLRMLLENVRERALFIEISQNYITDVDHCLECMKACPVGSRWNAMGRESS